MPHGNVDLIDYKQFISIESKKSIVLLSDTHWSVVLRAETTKDFLVWSEALAKVIGMYFAIYRISFSNVG